MRTEFKSRKQKHKLRRIAKIFDPISDNLIQLIEIGILVFVIIIPFIIDVQGCLGNHLQKNNISLDNLLPDLLINSGSFFDIFKAIFLFLLIKVGNWIVAIVLSILILSIVRKQNKEITMNRKNIYHKYSYLWYWFCAKILGIEKCSLILVPIYMQFKLVIKSIFNNFPLDERDYPVIDDEKDIKVTKLNWSSDSSEINMILEDTYQIDIKQIPDEKSNLPTIKISRNDGSSTVRHYSCKFINRVNDETRGLSNGVRVNVYATTNPMNTYNIAKRVFKIANRGNLAELYVYQQESTGSRLFESKGKKIY